MTAQRTLDPYREARQPTFRTSILGPLELVTAATAPLVSLERCKKHLRVEVDVHADDDVILDQLAAATAFCENEVDGSRTFLSSTYDLPVMGWWEDRLTLLRPPLQAVSLVSYTDSAAVVQTASSSLYLTRTPLRQPGTIERAPLQVWPSALQSDRSYPVTIRYLAGYVSPFTVVTATDVLTLTGRAPVNGQRVQVWTDNELPVGLQLDTTYYVVSASGQTCKLATSAGGSPIDITTTGTGTSYLGWVPRTITQAVLLTLGWLYANREPAKVEMDCVRSLLQAEGYGSY